jgi:hypothetical protein
MCHSKAPSSLPVSAAIAPTYCGISPVYSALSACGLLRAIEIEVAGVMLETSSFIAFQPEPLPDFSRPKVVPH